MERKLPEDLRSLLEDVTKKLEEREAEVQSEAGVAFASWCADNSVEELPLTGEQALEAMKNYFVAGPPLKVAKKRDDIPDAMLYQCIVELAAAGPLVFVCNDGRLAEAVESINSIRRYKGLNEFIASAEVQSLIIESELPTAEEPIAALPGALEEPAECAAEDQALEEAEKSIKSVLDELRLLSSSVPNVITDFVSSNGGADLAGTSFRSQSIPSDDKEAYIEMFGDLEDVHYDWNQAVYHGDSTYVVPFRGWGTFNISYYVSKWDIELIEARNGTYHEHNDYVVEAYEDAELSVSGTLRVVLSSVVAEDEDIGDAIEDMEIDSVDKPRLREDA